AKARARVVLLAEQLKREHGVTELLSRESPRAIREAALRAERAVASALLDRVAAALVERRVHEGLRDFAQAVDQRIAQLADRHREPERARGLRQRRVHGPILEAPREFLAG